MPETKSGRFQIGSVLADFDTNRIYVASGAVKVPPKPMALLYILMERGGQPVSRAELIESIWEGNVYVGKRGVTDAIHRLRKVLDDRSEQPQYIETIPKTGYRLLVAAVPETPTVEPVPVAPLTVTPATPIVSDSVDENPRGLGFRRSVQTVSALTMVLFCASLLFRGDELRQPTAGAPRPGNMMPVTYAPGIEHDTALSRDGTQLAYAWIKQRGSSRIMLRDLSRAEQTARALNNAPGLQRFPTFSTDGTRLAYVRLGVPTGPAIVVVDVAGGEETVYDGIGLVAGVSIDWSPTENQIAFSRYDADAGRGGIALLDLQDGNMRWLTSASGSHYFVDRGAVFSPSGDTLAFLRTSGMGVDLFTVTIDGVVRQVTRVGADIWGLDWMPDGQSLVFASSRLGHQGMNATLWQTDLAGTRQFIGGGPESHYFPVVDPSGTAIYVYVARPRMEINAVTLGGAGVIQPEARITSIGADQDPHFDPGRNRLVFASTRDGGGEIWTADRDGGHPLRLTALKSRAAFPRWSPDGSHIAFIAHDGVRTLHLLEPESGMITRLGELGAMHVCPSWSRDGRSVYAVKQVAGSLNLWRIPVAGGAGEAVTEAGGFYGQESPDGETLYFTKHSDDGLWAKPVGGGEARLVIDWQGRSGITWLPFSDRILFLSNHSDGPAILAFDLASGRSQVLAKFPPEVTVASRPWTFVAETKRLYFTCAVENEGDIRRLELDWTP